MSRLRGWRCEVCKAVRFTKAKAKRCATLDKIDRLTGVSRWDILPLDRPDYVVMTQTLYNQYEAALLGKLVEATKGGQ